MDQVPAGARVWLARGHTDAGRRARAARLGQETLKTRRR
jgi:hypothetical protein